MGVYVRMDTPDGATASRSCALARYDAEKIASDALSLLQKFNSAPQHQGAW